MAGMTLNEAKTHLANANQERPLGLSWAQIERMQGGKLKPLPKPRIPRKGRK
jgi:hypothetical protein